MTCTPHHHVWPPASDLCGCGGWEALGPRGMRRTAPPRAIDQNPGKRRGDGSDARHGQHSARWTRDNLAQLGCTCSPDAGARGVR